MRIRHGMTFLCLVVSLAVSSSAFVYGTQTPAEAPAPPPTAAVRQLLDEASGAAGQGKVADALALDDRALAAAQQVNDAPGEAMAQRARASELVKLGKLGDAANAWRAAEAAWKRADDGPGQVEASGWQAVLEIGDNPNGGAEQLRNTLRMATSETRRPRAALVSLLAPGVAFADRSRFPEARLMFETLTTAAAAAFPGGLEHASGLNALGLLAYRQANLSDARHYYEQALEIREAAAPNSLTLATSYNNLGAVTFDQGDVHAAREYHQRALAIKEKIAPDSLTVAASLNNLCGVARVQGDLDAAEDYGQRAVAIYERLTPGSFLLAQGLTNRGLVAWKRGDLAKAAEYMQQALAIQEKLAPHSLAVAGSYNNLGVIAFDRGDLDAARAYYERGLALKDELAPNTMEVAIALTNLGNVAMRQGDLGAARTLHQRALTMTEQVAPHSLDTANNLLNLGNDALLQGDLTAAGAYYTRGLDMRQELAPGSLDVAAAFDSLAALAFRRGDLTGAGDYGRQAMAIRERLAPNSLDVAESLNNLGALALSEGNLARASEYVERGLRIREELAPGSLAFAESLTNLGGIAAARHDPVAARESYRRALAIGERLAPDSVDIAEILRELGQLAYEQGDLPTAATDTLRAWTIVRRQAGTIAGDEASQAFQTHFHRTGSQLVALQLAQGDPDAAFATLEQGRAQGLLHLQSERGIARRLAPRELWQTFEIAQASSNRAGKALEQAGGREGTALAALDAEIAQQSQGRVIEEKRRELSDRHKESEQALQTYTQLRTETERRWADVTKAISSALPPPAPLDESRRILPRDAMLASFLVGEHETTLFIVRPEDPARAFSLKISRKELSSRVDFVRRAVSGETDARGVKLVDSAEVRVKAARDLFQKLFPAEARDIIKRSGRLILSPDDTLWDLPFAALVMNDEGSPKYLGLEKPLVYTQSLATLAQTMAAERKPAGKPAVLVVGNPLFDTTLHTGRMTDRAVKPRPAAVPGPATGHRDGGELALLSRDGEAPEPLPYAEQEAVEIAKLYGTRAAVGPEPTEAWFRQRAPHADIIHLATHGYFNPFRAISSGVRLAVAGLQPDPAATDNDGALQAWEVMTQLQLRADVVVLSACQTGSGSAVPGEGLVGLTRAFQVAGAASVVATQWRIPDRSTAGGMVEFHRGLRRGLPKDEALRLAMKRIADDAGTAHPAHWAPFVLFGDFRPLRTTTDRSRAASPGSPR